MNKRLAKFTLATVLILIVCLVLDMLNIPTTLIGYSIYNFSFAFWDMILPVVALVIIATAVYEMIMKRFDEEYDAKKDYAHFLMSSYFDSVRDAVMLVDSPTIKSLLKDREDLRFVGREGCLCSNLLRPGEDIYRQLEKVMSTDILSEDDIKNILNVRKESNLFFTFAFTFCEREEMYRERKNQLLKLLNTD